MTIHESFIGYKRMPPKLQLLIESKIKAHKGDFTSLHCMASLLYGLHHIMSLTSKTCFYNEVGPPLCFNLQPAYSIIIQVLIILDEPLGAKIKGGFLYSRPIWRSWTQECNF